MKGLNLQGFNKIKEDKDTVHMKNKDGHVIVLAVKALPKIQREQLKRLSLADGGVAHYAHGADPIKKISVKTEQGDTDPFDAEYIDNRKLYGQYLPEKINLGDSDPSYNQTGNVPENIKEADISSVEEGPPMNTNVGTAPMQKPSLDTNQNPQQAPAQQAPQNPVGSNPNLLNRDKTLNAPAAVKLQMQADQEQAAIDAEKGRQQAIVENARLEPQQEQLDLIKSRYNELKGHTDDFKTYNDQHPINEKHYAETMGVGNKIATAFGLLAGGFGSGLTGQANPAMDYLNKQIDRDIDAQKSRLDQQKTVLGAYQHLYGEGVVANNLTRVSMNDIYDTKMREIAAKLATPQALQLQHKMEAEHAIQNNQLLTDAAGRRHTLNKDLSNPSMAAPAIQSVPQGKQKSMVTTAQGGPGTGGGRFGLPKSEASIEPNEPLLKPDKYIDSPILFKNAEDQYVSAQYNPIMKDQKGELLKQYTQAKQADLALSQLHDVHQEMVNQTKDPGYSYLRRHNPLEGVPFLGEALNHNVLQPTTDTPVNRSYAANRTRIMADIANAVGPNVSSVEIERLVNDNLPERNDPPALVAQKERNIRVFIKNRVPTSLLQLGEMSEKH